MPGDSVVIRLPDPRALRVVARSVLLAVALLAMPWLRAAEAPARRRAADACGAAAAQAELLLRDLHREGLLVPGARAVVIGADGDCDAAGLQPLQDEDNAMRPISLQRMLMIGDSSVDFLLDFGYFDDEADRFGFADRVLKSGGILAAPVGSLSVFSLPQNYRVIYVHQFAETFVGIKKIAHAAGYFGNDGTRMELPSAGVAALKEGMVSGHPAESDKAQLKNTGRKLLSEITRAPGGRHQDFRVDSAALWNLNKATSNKL